MNERTENYQIEIQYNFKIMDIFAETVITLKLLRLLRNINSSNLKLTYYMLYYAKVIHIFLPKRQILNSGSKKALFLIMACKYKN